MTTHGQGVSPADGAPAGVKGLAPYKPGRPIEEVARELGLDPAGIVKLASNENPLGMSPCSRCWRWAMPAIRMPTGTT